MKTDYKLINAEEGIYAEEYRALGSDSHQSDGTLETPLASKNNGPKRTNLQSPSRKTVELKGGGDN